MPTVQPLTLDLLRRPWLRDVPSPPHDALSAEQRRAHLKKYPMSYLGVTRAPEDFDAEPGQTPRNLFEAGRRSLDELIAAGVFEPATEPRYFIYRLEIDGHRQTGLVCGVTVADFDAGEVRIHERVKTDRTTHLARHLEVVGAQSSPIALASRDPHGELGRLIEDCTRSEPAALDIVTDDGLRQRIWPVTDTDQSLRLTEAASAEPLYLIDGHHRAAAATQHRHGCPDVGDRPGDDWVLSTIFPAGEMRNKAFHRVVKVESPESLLRQLGDRFDLEPVTSLDDVAERRAGVIGVGHREPNGGVSWSLLHLPAPPATANVVERLDPTRLAELVLTPVLHLDEGNPQGRLRYVPGPADARALDRIHIDPDEVLFAVRPVTMSELFDASDASLVMPPKSTYFDPKVRSGLFVHFKERV